MKLIVIEVTKNGKTGYLSSTSAFSSSNIVSNPMEAINYALPENAGDIQYDLRSLRVDDGQAYAKSGVLVDRAQIVEFEVAVKEIARRPGREARTSCVPG